MIDTCLATLTATGVNQGLTSNLIKQKKKSCYRKVFVIFLASASFLKKQKSPNSFPSITLSTLSCVFFYFFVWKTARKRSQLVIVKPHLDLNLRSL
jgi:hypothetical protein